MPSANLEKLNKALGQIDRPGTFALSGSEPAVLPGLEVEGLGPVGLPLTARTAKDLLKHCHQAPYGKGEQTLVDTKVRRVWRLEPAYFALKNPDWERVIKEILLASLAALDDTRLIADFLGGALMKDATAEPGQSIAAIGQKLGWSTIRPQLASLMEGTTLATMERNVRLLESIATARPRKKAEWAELCATLAPVLVSAIESIDRSASPIDWRYHPVDRAELLAGLARSLIATDPAELMSRLVDHALATPAKYPLTEVHIRALAGLRPWIEKNVRKRSAALARWLDAVREQLEAMTARAPKEPADSRRPAPINCTCGDCAELTQFLQDPREPVHRFRVAKERRRHLHSQIDANKIDLTHVTDRRGSPQTLVCTKTMASYQASLRKYHEDREHLRTIEAIRASLPK